MISQTQKNDEVPWIWFQCKSYLGGVAWQCFAITGTSCLVYIKWTAFIIIFNELMDVFTWFYIVFEMNAAQGNWFGPKDKSFPLEISSFGISCMSQLAIRISCLSDSIHVAGMLLICTKWLARSLKERTCFYNLQKYQVHSATRNRECKLFSIATFYQLSSSAVVAVIGLSFWAGVVRWDSKEVCRAFVHLSTACWIYLHSMLTVWCLKPGGFNDFFVFNIVTFLRTLTRMALLPVNPGVFNLLNMQRGRSCFLAGFCVVFVSQCGGSAGPFISSLTHACSM